MSTTEDRLRAALAARAEQVQEAGLALAAPRPPRPPRRTSAGWRVPVAVAAACVAAVGTTYVVLHHDRNVAPAPADTPYRLTGDLDGDGKPDTITLDKGGKITARLGDGRVLRVSVRTPAELVGIADVDAPAKTIVVAEEPTASEFNQMNDESVPTKAFGAARVATVLQIGDHGRLVRTAFDQEAAAPLERTPGIWFWVADGRLYGTLDREPTGQIVVDAGRYSLVRGKLTPADGVEMCWDTAIEAAPSSCRPGHDYRRRIGPRGSLPRLYPEQSSRKNALTGDVGGQPVEATLSRPDRSGHSTLEVRVAGTTYRASTPAVSPPDGALFPLLVPDRAHPDGFGIALFFECCDSAKVLLYSFSDGRLAQVAVPPDLHFGDGFYGTPQRYYRTWQGPTGVLFTSNGGLEDGSRLDVLVDRLVDGRLEQSSIGPVCLDPKAHERWGTCVR